MNTQLKTFISDAELTALFGDNILYTICEPEITATGAINGCAVEYKSETFAWDNAGNLCQINSYHYQHQSDVDNVIDLGELAWENPMHTVEILKPRY